MAAYYNARGNTYFVVTPDELIDLKVPREASEAANTYPNWAMSAVERYCSHSPAHHNDIGLKKKYRSDGLLVGPFSSKDGFGLLILNTTGTLAERSGNGLTIFSQFLVDTLRVERTTLFSLVVYNGKVGSQPIGSQVQPANWEGRDGFWVDMGIPTFGPQAVGASLGSIVLTQLNGHDSFCVKALKEIDESWTHSNFVSVDNPHCVTFMHSAVDLPSMDLIGSSQMKSRLRSIANSSVVGEERGDGTPCVDGINLQWAALAGPGAIKARVFERSEGPTMSSGSSAVAVASAGRHIGLLSDSLVRVEMPGGTAPVRFRESGGRCIGVSLFGEAKRTPCPE